MYKKNNIPPEMQANNSPAYQNWRRDRDEAIRQSGAAQVKEGFPTVVVNVHCTATGRIVYCGPIF
jgi:hypothetical protein